MSFIHALTANPALILRHRNIFLLSHMRANTSLLGHLMGSHPQIEGYYEMHLAYFGWKSLWRQKLRHFSDHAPKPGSSFMFDKVLHNDHHVATTLLLRAQCRTLMMLRAPEQSIKSLVVMYRQRRPDLPEASVEGATRYYVDRLAALAGTAEAIGSRYFYLDAECLISATEPTLLAMSDWLGLQQPIPNQYNTFSNTGLGTAGDDSSRMKSGKVQRALSDYSDIVVPPTLMRAAEAAYEQCRGQLISRSARNAIL